MADRARSDDIVQQPMVWIGRVVRKMKRKHHLELSLKVDSLPQTQRLHVSKDASVMIRHPICLMLQSLVRVRVLPKPDSDHTWEGLNIDLLECPPDPLRIRVILEEPTLWKTLQPYEANKEGEEATEEDSFPEDYANANYQMVRRIVMRLQRRQPTQPRKRPPRLNNKLLKELEELEDQVQLVDIQDDNNAIGLSVVADGCVASSSWNLPETKDDRELMSGHHKLTRQQYLQSKKFPQISWILERLAKFPGQPFRHIVDVGGGRGDLAISLAKLGSHVTVVDLNASSLEAGRRFAEDRGVSDRMTWVCEDFTTFASNANIDIDAVVALHACGNLSDHALRYAVCLNASFLICPCCYSKMEIQNAATHLAEINERPDLSRRGMHVVNSQRYWDLKDQNSYTIRIEEYSREWSARNMVLLGWPTATP